MKKTLIVLIWILILGNLAQAETTKKQWSDLCRFPNDTTETQDLRVWLAQEMDSTCRMVVTIHDSTDAVIRTLIDMDIRPGYFNLYWDKKDDSGDYAPVGSYIYRTNYCGGERSGELKVKYKKWESTSYLKADDFLSTSTIKFGITQDSAIVTLMICDDRETPVYTPIKNAILFPGNYEYQYKISQAIRRRGKIIKLYVNDYVHQVRFRD